MCKVWDRFNRLDIIHFIRPPPSCEFWWITGIKKWKGDPYKMYSIKFVQPGSNLAKFKIKQVLYLFLQGILLHLRRGTISLSNTLIKYDFCFGRNKVWKKNFLIPKNKWLGIKTFNNVMVACLKWVKINAKSHATSKLSLH